MRAHLLRCIYVDRASNLHPMRMLELYRSASATELKPRSLELGVGESWLLEPENSSHRINLFVDRDDPVLRRRVADSGGNCEQIDDEAGGGVRVEEEQYFESRQR